MKIFITGVTGYIGHSLALKLAQQGHTIHALVRNIHSDRIPLHPRIQVFAGDLGSPHTVALAMKTCQVAYHVAGLSRLWARDRNEFYEANVVGTRHVLATALDMGIKKLVLTSSAAVFGQSLRVPLSEKDPRVTGFDSDYDLSKFIGECLLQEFLRNGLFGVIVNPSRVYGPGLPTESNPITRMVERCIRHQPVFFPGCKDVIGNYAYIGDVIQGHIAAMEKGIGGERYILGGENLTHGQVASIVSEETSYAGLVGCPVFLMKGIGMAELLRSKICRKEPAFTPSIIERLTRNAALSCSKAIHQLGYSITPFREGIRQTITQLTPNNGKQIFYINYGRQ